ncbi:MAG TPA: TRAP transporter small permease [Candidatus Corynebacterium gallistercoris]|uniref:TRAP transporter small permease n=1 Tax=Candidatus Corynebacterium gallistercoris TaxID=2838530 RepID=A0A9D1S201_9CORY|nr:TRAP transporter small permease [Candidatus Corynebacterium gallistercoris]
MHEFNPKATVADTQLQRLSGRINRVVEYLAATFLILLSLAAMLQVLTRHVLDFSFVWTEELSRFSFIWCSFLGASVLTYHGGHATLDFLHDRLHGRSRAYHSLLVEVIVFLIASCLVIFSIPLVTITYQQLSPALQIPMACVYSAVMVTGALIAFHSLARGQAALRSIKSQKKAGE